MGSRLLEQLRDSLNENLDTRTREQTEAAIDVLEKYVLYTRETVFHVGDFVVWKEGMSCRSVPKDDEVGIVTAVLDKPIFDPLRKSSGTPNFREPLSIRIAVRANDTFIEFYMDGSRMETIAYESLTGAQRGCADYLTDCLNKLTKQPPEKFKNGDIVQWKPGMKCTKRPEYNQQCVVMETFPPHQSNRRGACAAGFREPSDIRIGVLDDDGDLMIYLFDSRRFEKVPESQWE